MEEILFYSSLYDYYGKLLTEREQLYFEDYFFNNLSLQEIADNFKVSKNAVSKTIKSVKDKLDNYENILHLNNNKKEIKRIISEDLFDKISDYI